MSSIVVTEHPKVSLIKFCGLFSLISLQGHAITGKEAVARAPFTILSLNKDYCVQSSISQLLVETGCLII